MSLYMTIYKLTFDYWFLILFNTLVFTEKQCTSKVLEMYKVLFDMTWCRAGSDAEQDLMKMSCGTFTTTSTTTRITAPSHKRRSAGGSTAEQDWIGGRRSSGEKRDHWNSTIQVWPGQDLCFYLAFASDKEDCLWWLLCSATLSRHNSQTAPLNSLVYILSWTVPPL